MKTTPDIQVTQYWIMPYSSALKYLNIIVEAFKKKNNLQIQDLAGSLKIIPITSNSNFITLIWDKEWICKAIPEDDNCKRFIFEINKNLVDKEEIVKMEKTLI